MYVILVLVAVAILIFSSCGNDSKEKLVTIPIEPKISTEDSTRIAETAVEVFVKAEHRKKIVADSLRMALGFKDFDFSELNWFPFSFNQSNSRPNSTTELYDVDYVSFEIRYAFAISHNDFRILLSEAQRNSDKIINVLDKNKTAFRKFLEITKNLGAARELYGREMIWVEHSKPDKEKLFLEFFSKYGHLADFPYNGDTAQVSVVFWSDMEKIIKSDPIFFNYTENYPLRKYREWLFVHRWKNRLGEVTMKKYAESIRSILFD